MLSGTRRRSYSERSSRAGTDRRHESCSRCNQFPQAAIADMGDSSHAHCGNDMVGLTEFIRTSVRALHSPFSMFDSAPTHTRTGRGARPAVVALLVV
eukprot:4535542-Prymnesium_polylepis.1